MIIDQLIMVVKSVIDNVLNVGGLSNETRRKRLIIKRPLCKIGDKVSSKYLKNYEIEKMEWVDTNNRVIYKLRGMGWYSADELQPYKEETMEETIKEKPFNIII